MACKHTFARFYSIPIAGGKYLAWVEESKIAPTTRKGTWRYQCVKCKCQGYAIKGMP